MTFYEHIRELQEELSGCNSAREVRQIKRELEAAVAQMARSGAGLDTFIASS